MATGSFSDPIIVMAMPVSIVLLIIMPPKNGSSGREQNPLDKSQEKVSSLVHDGGRFEAVCASGVVSISDMGGIPSFSLFPVASRKGLGVNNAGSGKEQKA